MLSARPGRKRGGVGEGSELVGGDPSFSIQTKIASVGSDVGPSVESPGNHIEASGFDRFQEADSDLGLVGDQGEADLPSLSFALQLFPARDHRRTMWKGKGAILFGRGRFG